MKRYAYIPVMIFFIVFIIDKIFLNRQLQLLTQKDATFLYYQYKEELLEELSKFYINNKKQKNPIKILIIMGSSRLMFVDYQQFKKAYPEWEMFNFSVPVNSPAYYLYIIEKILKKQIRPDLIILESDLYQFNEYSPGFKKSNLPYSFDLEFVIRYFHLFQREEVSEFLGYMLFAGKRYPPDIATLWKRLQNPDETLLTIFKKTDAFQRKHRGCGLAPIAFQEWYVRDLSEIEMSAEGTIQWLYKKFKYSERQWIFFKKTIRTLEDHQIPYLIIKPQVSPVMEALLKNHTKIHNAYLLWKQKLRQLLPASKWIDFSESKTFYCNTFVDGSHMSKECYDPMLFTIMQRYQQVFSLYP